MSGWIEPFASIIALSESLNVFTPRRLARLDVKQRDLIFSDQLSVCRDWRPTVGTENA